MKLVTPRHSIDRKPRADDFAIIEREPPSCPPDGILARVVYASLDPYTGSILRGRHMGEAPPAPMEQAVPSAVIAEVTQSSLPGIRPGDHVHSMAGAWQQVVALSEGTFRKVSPGDAPLSAFLGVLGMPGLTAWGGMTKLSGLEEGDVFLVDAAAGAVGGTAGQIARIMGASRVVGIAGGPEKCAIVTERYGFDTCIDYREAGWQEALAHALPGGVDVFFENVSAEMAMKALAHANPYARGVLCGLVDAYHGKERSSHPINAGLVIARRARLSGLVVYDFFDRWDTFTKDVSGWLREGRLRFEEDRAEGIEALPGHFEKLMDGRNRGKTLVCFGPEVS